MQLVLGISASNKEQTGGGDAGDAGEAADAADSAGLVSAAAPSKRRRRRRRPCPKVRRRAAHRLFGWGLFTLAIVNVDLGIHQLPLRASLKEHISLGYRIAVLCLVVLPMALLEWRLQRHYWRTGVETCWSWRLCTALGALQRPAWCGGTGEPTAANKPSTGGEASARRASGTPGSPGRRTSPLSPARLLERRTSSERRASSEQPPLTPAAALLRAGDRHQTYFHGKGLAEAAAALRDRDVRVLQSGALRAFLRLAPLPRRAQLPQFAELLHVVSHFGSNVPLFYKVPASAGGAHTRQARARSKDAMTPPGSPTRSPSPSSSPRRRSLTRSISGKLNLEVQASDADGTVTIGDSLQALCARLQVQRIGAQGTCLVNRFVVVLSGVLCEEVAEEGGQEPTHTRYYCAGDAFEPRGGRERSVRAVVTSDGSVPNGGAAPAKLPRGPGAGRAKLAGRSSSPVGRSSPTISVDVGVQGAVASGKASITTSTQGGAADSKQFAWAMTVHSAAMALYRKELRAACHAEARRKAGLDMQDRSVKRESFTGASPLLSGRSATASCNPSPEQGLQATLAGRMRQSLADGEPLAPPRIPALKLGELEGVLAQVST